MINAIVQQNRYILLEWDLTTGGEKQMKLTKYQQQNLEKIQNHLKEQMADREYTAENMAHAMQSYNDCFDYENALLASSQILEGQTTYFALCKDKDVLCDPDFAEKMMDRITGEMNQEQKKGFYLQGLDLFEQGPGSEEEISARAGLTEEELKELLADRMDEFLELSMSGMSDVLEDSYFCRETQNFGTAGTITKEDAFLFAAAEYLASLDGTLPLEFGKCPQLLGSCTAMQMMLAEYAQEYDEEDEGFSVILENLLYAAMGAVFAIGAITVLIAANPLLETMAFSIIGLFASILIELTLYMTALHGCLAVIGGLAEAVSECVQKWKKHREAKRDTQVLEKNEAEQNRWEDEVLFSKEELA